jgi:hypothetical protein
MSTDDLSNLCDTCPTISSNDEKWSDTDTIDYLNNLYDTKLHEHTDIENLLNEMTDEVFNVILEPLFEPVDFEPNDFEEDVCIFADSCDNYCKNCCKTKDCFISSLDDIDG